MKEMLIFAIYDNLGAIHNYRLFKISPFGQNVGGWVNLKWIIEKRNFF